MSNRRHYLQIVFLNFIKDFELVLRRRPEPASLLNHTSRGDEMLLEDYSQLQVLFIFSLHLHEK